MDALWCKIQNQWRPLPGWARFLVNLGWEIGEVNAGPGGRLVIAILVPTRAYAALFLALGTVMGRAASRSDRMAHYEQLASLPSGTSFLYRTSQGVYKARFKRRSKPDETPYLYLEMKDDKVLTGVRWDQSFKVTQGWGEITDLPKRLLPVEVSRSTPFLRKLLGRSEAEDHIWFTQLDSLLVGTMSQFEAEMNSVELGVSYHGLVLPGNLQDVLRPARLLGHGHPYRTHFWSPWTDIVEDKTDRPSIAPHLVICDGGAAFLQARDRWPSSHLCVVMERHDTWFTEAVDVLRQGFLIRAAEDGLGELPSPPRGMEVSVYREVVTG